MSDVAVRVESLGKQYRIGAEQERYPTLRDAVAGAFRAPLRWFRRDGRGPSSPETFWALKDVSFEVKRGEVVGIIGRNGAGKTTLLKILSRITEPTGGHAEIQGRVSSLLEVGTGFHPELTGRENIYLNGAILGMRKADIDRKFDEIVAFAEIEKFLDTPVKRYSSGMYVRLAFAVAAHLEPEILLVDEVLAVGDAAFQRKCLGKMGDVAQEGRTVLFVSHNMGAISTLCERCIWLEAGILKDIDSTSRIIQEYLSNSQNAIANKRNRLLQKEAVIVSVNCIDSNGNECSAIRIGDEMTLVILYELSREMHALGFGISIETPTGQRIFGSNTGREGLHSGTVKGSGSAYFRMPRALLGPGIYFVTAAIHAPGGSILDLFEEAANFEVIAADLTGSGNLVRMQDGPVWLDHDWCI